MKVLQINTVCGVLSTGRIATDLAEVLEEQGHECKIAYGRLLVPEKYKKYAIRIANNLDVNLHALQSRIFDNTGFNSRKATKRFTDWINEYDPDIIHLHNLHGYYLNIKELFQYLVSANKPVIWTLHSCWAFTGHCGYFDLIGCERWKTGCYRCPHNKGIPKIHGNISLIDNSRKNYEEKKRIFTSVKNMIIITPSIWLSKLVERSFLGKYKIQVINNGIDLTSFKPTAGDFRVRYGIDDKKIVLGVASTWDKRKGLDDFIKLSRLLDHSYKIVLVGLSPEQVRMMPINTLGITRTYSVTELAEIYTMADVFVNPTYEDNFPAVNLEALACGTPVITYNTGGSPEVIDATCGIVTTKGDIHSLKAAVESACFSQIRECDCTNRSKMYEKRDSYSKYIELYAANVPYRDSMINSSMKDGDSYPDSPC